MKISFAYKRLIKTKVVKASLILNNKIYQKRNFLACTYIKKPYQEKCFYLRQNYQKKNKHFLNKNLMVIQMMLKIHGLQSTPLYQTNQKQAATLFLLTVN